MRSVSAQATILVIARTVAINAKSLIFLANAKLTHGSLRAADGSITGQGEGAEAAEAASVTEPVKLWPHFSTTRAESRWCAAYGSVL